MRAPCDDRGADLFLLARDGGGPGPEFAGHLAACEGCREELVHLRRLAGALPDATGRLRPRPSTKTDLMKEIEAVLAAGDAPPPPPRLRRPLLAFWVPLGAVAASFLLTVWALSRDGAEPPLPVETAGAVEVRPLFGGAALDGLVPSGLAAGADLSARETASIRLGPPFAAEIVLGGGAALRIPKAPPGGPALLLLRGAAWFAPAGGGPLTVRAGEVTVSGRGTFAVERRAGGLVSVIVESGDCSVGAAGVFTAARGPCRVEVEPGKRPGDPIPAEAADATAWFAYPEVRIDPDADGDPLHFLLSVTPSVPRTLPLSPWNRFDPLFQLRLTDGAGRTLLLPLPAHLLRRPAPLPDGDGVFPLGPDTPYRLWLDLTRLKIDPGRYGLQVIYEASRSGGGWRGTRPSNAVDLEFP